MTNLIPLQIQGQTLRCPLLLAGPCSAETEEQVIDTARQLARAGVKIFRAGIWKPRTMPGNFEGVGEKGLPWLQRVKKETGMAVATEVATPAHIEACLKAGVDILWVGARTSANPFAIQEIAEALRGVDNVPLFVKNPLNPDLEAWIGAFERLYAAGLRRLGAIHRGFSFFGPHLYRNPPLWRVAFDLHLRIPEMQIIVDPSHIAGRRDLVPKLCMGALAMGFDGLIVETHCNPDQAWSDARQQLTPAQLAELIPSFRFRHGQTSTDTLAELRRQIDNADDELIDLLARRMQISDEIGRYKHRNAMPIVQTGRFEALMSDRVKSAGKLGMSEPFMRTILAAIHEESVRRQTEIAEAADPHADKLL